MKNITVELDEYNYNIFKLICNENKITYSNEVTKYILQNKNIIPEKINIKKPTKTVFSLAEEVFEIIKSNPYTNKSIINYIIYTYVNGLDNDELFRYEEILKENSRKIKPKRRCIDNYIDFKYKDKELKILNLITLTEQQLIGYRNLKEVLAKSKFKPVAKDMFKLFINGYSPDDLGEVYLCSPRTIQKCLKKSGLNRNRYEAQAIASRKRDYKTISNKSRKTLLKNNTIIQGSNQENYLRNVLNCQLSLMLSNYEVVVGINNRSILSDGKEVDIPIIIITPENKVHKFAIEYDGAFWHENKEKDKLKNKNLTDKGYNIFRVIHDGTKTDKQFKDFIESEVEKICNSIYSVI